MEEEEQEQEEEESGILGDGFSAYFPSFAKNLLRVKVENVPFGCFDSECCCSVLNVAVLSLPYVKFDVGKFPFKRKAHVLLDRQAEFSKYSYSC